ncbi:MAG: sodium ion-translocating decarboxylase subunit beta, partial [Akkermansia sp.]
MLDSILNFLQGMGVFALTWQMLVMWVVAIVLLWLGVAKQFEPLLLVPIAFGALIANIPDNGMLITKVNKEIVSVENGKATKTQFVDVGFITVDIAPIVSPAQSTKQASLNVEEQAKYDAASAKPMVATPVMKDGKPVSGQYNLEGQKASKFMIASFHGGLYDWLGLGIKAEIFPPIIFLGVGALTDFGPLLAAP